jgi:hypothetical protein
MQKKQHWSDVSYKQCTQEAIRLVALSVRQVQSDIERNV